VRMHTHGRVPHVSMRWTHQHGSHVGVTMARRTGVHHVVVHGNSSARSGDGRWHWSHTMNCGSCDRRFSGRVLCALPSLLRNFHCKFRPTLILDFSTLVDQLLRPCKVHALNTLALGSTHDPGLEALTVLFQTLRALATTSHVVTILRRGSHGNSP